MLSVYDYIEETLRVSTESISAHENELLIYVENFAPQNSEEKHYFYHELFSGAYIFIPDNGKMYEAFSSFEEQDLTYRHDFSSHCSLDPQYSFQGDLVVECLFGTTQVGEEKGSWFQLEAYGINLVQLPGHIYSYFVYTFTGNNQGPYGSSIYTEGNPLIMKNSNYLEPDFSHMSTMEPLNSPISMTQSDVILETDILNETIPLQDIKIAFEPSETISLAPIFLINPQNDIIQEQMIVHAE